MSEENMESDATVTISTAQVRAHVSCGIEQQITGLRNLDWKKRLPPLSFFGLLCAAGIAVNVLSFKATALTTGLRVIGVIATAIALNGFVLLLHEGMHN